MEHPRETVDETWPEGHPTKGSEPMDIEARLAAIDAAEGDPENAHTLEDALMVDLLRELESELPYERKLGRFLDWYDDEVAQQGRTRWYA